METTAKGYPLDENLVIAEAVLAELAADPRTTTSLIEAVYEQGVITLSGEAAGEEAHRAAEEIAHQHEHVVSVVNALEVQPKLTTMDTVVDALIQMTGPAFSAKIG
jgi:osmotically-inducible protein OsmY